MKIGNLAKVEELSMDLRRVKNFMRTPGNFSIRKEFYTLVKFYGCGKEKLDFPYELIEPVLIERMKQIESELKNLGVEIE